MQIGLNVHYSLHGLPGAVDDILRDMIQLNLSTSGYYLGKNVANASGESREGAAPRRKPTDG